MRDRRVVIWGLVCLFLLGAAFALGRWTAPARLLDASPGSAAVATFSGGSLGADDVRPLLAGMGSDPKARRAAVEQMVRARLLAREAEAAGMHRTPEFLGRYAEELARVYLEKAFEEPFQKRLPTSGEVRRFFDENKARLGRPERVRLAHVALLAPKGDAAARAQKRAMAEQVLAEVRKVAKDEYAFGRLALTRSEDPRSRPAAGELPFLTRDEAAQRLGPEVVEVAFALQPGRVAERVVETQRGFEVVKVLAREEGREASYEEMREGIKARLAADRRDRAFKEFMDALWAKADVHIDEQALARVEAKEKQGK